MLSLLTESLVLRYGWVDVHDRPCQTALQFGAVAVERGWTGSLRRCGPSCGAQVNNLVD
jgi:hypothetical protein